MRFRHLLITLFLVAQAAVGITGCGQKGPLVPPKASTVLAVASAAPCVNADGMTATT